MHRCDILKGFPIDSSLIEIDAVTVGMISFKRQGPMLF